MRATCEDHTLLLVLHHAVADGWSLRLLARELEVSYAAALAKTEPDLPRLPIQYCDYAAWQRTELMGAALTPLLASWRERFAAAPQLLSLSSDRPRPAMLTTRGAVETLDLSPEVAIGLRLAARQRGATLFMALFASWSALLQRYTGQSDLVIGTVLANRGQRETENLIGFFANTLPMRVEARGEESWEELLARAKEATLWLFAREETPFERLVEVLRPQRDLSTAPLFQIMLVLQDGPWAAPQLAGTSCEARPPQCLHAGGAKFDLTLSFLPSRGGLGGELEFSTDLFDAVTIRRCASHLATLCAAVAADAQLPVSDLPLLASAEELQILQEWNPLATGAQSSKGLHQLFEEKVAHDPHAIALRWHGTALGYGELDRHATTLARHLHACGVGPEVRVALLCRRTPRMVVALLAVLKSGGAYVPLDPSYPPERLTRIVAGSGAGLVLVEAEVAHRLPPTGATILSLGDDDIQEEAKAPVLPPHLFLGAAQAAYVLYTSGSTGEPKGIVVPHGGVVALIDAVRTILSPHDLAGVLAATSICFDLSVFELFATLAAGGTVVLGDDFLDLAEMPDSAFVTLINTVPSALSGLLADRPLPPSVRVVNLAGEALSRELGSRVYREPGVETVYNFYGPTEDTVYSTWSAVSRQDDREPTIGRPLPRRRSHVLDAAGRPVPIGVPGEIWLGGDGLARGYAGQPELTAERFRPDPWSAQPGRRLYRTGDLARWLPSGEIHFLGRLDHQVKLRGFRIELAEIEAVLGRCPAVQQAAVLVREDGRERRLVAYAAARAGAELTPTLLRSYLKERLPEFMIPSFVVLPSLPLTPNGKIDRGDLATIGVGATGTTDRRIAPRTPTEELLATDWCELLGVERVGADDDFFALGGHSLLATRAVSRVRRSFGIEVPIRVLFERPTLAELSTEIERRRRGGEQPSGAPLLPRPRQDFPPLSFAQKRLWFLDRLEPGGSAYNIPVALRMWGSLSVAAMAACLLEIAQRHEPLRTTFAEVEEEAVQVIAPAIDLPLPLVDLAELPARLQEREWARLERTAAERGFDLARGPLLRVLLARLRSEEHVALFSLHHIISDAWSMGVFLRELATLYGAWLSGHPSPLPELPIRYSDFVLWQRESLTAEVLENHLAYWRHQLSKIPSLLSLPTDRPRPAARVGNGGMVSFDLPGEVVAEARTLSRREGSTLFMTLLSAFQALLSRYSGTDEVPVGTAVANRTQAEVEGLIGLFVNTLVLLGDLGRDPGFASFLTQTRSSLLDAYEHQDLPFEMLVDELSPERSLSHTPLFQVMLTLQNVPLGELTLPGLTLERVAVSPGKSKFDLSVTLWERAGSLSGEVEYDAALFDVSRIRRLVGHLEALLRAAVAEPARPVSELPLLTPAELWQASREWNDTPADLPSASTIHGAVELQTERTPEAVAVTDGGAHLTYGELNRRANRLARRLRRSGIGPEMRVGVLVERSPELVTTLLGTLKSGAAYVPLDPSYPDDRLRAMVEEAEMGAIVLGVGLEGRLAELRPREGLAQVRLETDRTAISAEDGADLPSSNLPGNLAYLIFTSGSTGRPKGVAVEHRGAVLLLRWASAVLSAEECAVVLFATSVSFDVSVFEVFFPLANGGRLVVARNVLDLPALATAAITLVCAVPSATAELLRLGGVPASVRALLLAGEALSGPLVESISAACPGLRVVNAYGPSEDTIYSTLHPVVASGADWLPIGRPIANGRMYVLDRKGAPQPVGAPGDLHLGGPGLARGYHGRPALTAERFLPDAGSGEPGGRLYRTGDLTRFLPDGTLEFIGRTDRQVKIRGVRIELGEVEAALLRLPGVRAAAAQVHGEAAARRIVAFLATSGDASPSELRSRLRTLVPDTMIPAELILLDALPLSPTGKVDLTALSRLSATHATEPTAYVAPTTPLEENLTTLWEEILEVPRVGIHDDFFALGGHSLIATRVVSRIRGRLGVELPLRSLFEAPTPASLAKRIEAARRPADGPIPRAPRTGLLPLSFSQQREWLLDQLTPGSPAFNIAHAIRLLGTLDWAAFHAALDRVVNRHEALRTRFPRVDGRPTQVIAEVSATTWPEIDLAILPAPRRQDELRRLADEDALFSFDLAQGPLFRVSLIRLEAGDQVLLLNLHHIVSDGWSMGVLIREIATLYADFKAGKPPSLPDLPIQYADFAVWQRSHLAGDVLAALLSYWRRQLGGNRPALALPADHPRPAVQSFRGGEIAFTLPAAVSRGVAAAADGARASRFMVLLTAFKALLHRWAGDTDLSVGTFIANRNRSEIEPLIGFFVNTLVLRTELTDAQPFSQLLARVREGTLEAYAHQDLPFEKLVEELQPQRALSHTPLFQVMLVFQNKTELAGVFPGLTSEVLPLPTRRSNFDLTLWFWETPDGLAGTLHYSTDLFERPTALRFREHFEVLLAAALERPAGAIGDLVLLGEAQRYQVITGWNDSPPSAHAAPVHRIISARAAETPDAIAVSSAGRELSYGELEKRSSRLAQVLRSAGVGPESRVGLCAERGPDQVAALLAVLKAGAAYVPIDPAYPHDRIELMLGDAGVSLLLAEQKVLPLLSVADLRVLFLDRYHASEDAAPPPAWSSPQSLAYVIFTSGSTGRPKGVLVPHGGLAAYTLAAVARFGLTPGDRVLQFASISFDASAEEIYPCLAAGATLVMRDEAMLRSPDAFFASCAAWAVSVLDLPTAYWHELAVDLGRRPLAVPASVRLVIVGGERVLAERWAQFRRSAERVRLLNTYGPTEATIVATASELGLPARHGDGAWREALIGRPVAGVRTYVLDPRGKPQPVGLPGELQLAGTGLARGYAGDPAATALRFVPDPFGAEPGGRLYRTGDRARWNPEGQLEFLGRTDTQVKIRGFRVEPGEVEAVLARHPAIALAAVTVREDEPGRRRLVAYAVAAPQQVTSAAELRAFLAQTLPEHMIPAAVVLVDTLPSNAAGKLDRAALQRIEAQEVGEDYAAPQRLSEEVLAAIWSEVLGVERIGLHDNFFALGGHSLLATQIVARVQKTFEVELPLRAFFEAPTLSEARGANRQRQPRLRAPTSRLPARRRSTPLLLPRTHLVPRPARAREYRLSRATGDADLGPLGYRHPRPRLSRLDRAPRDLAHDLSGGRRTSRPAHPLRLPNRELSAAGRRLG